MSHESAVEYSVVEDPIAVQAMPEKMSYDQQRRSSSNALAKISAVAADQRRASAVGQATILSIPKDEQLGVDTQRKSAQMVVTNVIRISGSELGAEQQNDEATDASMEKKLSGKKETTEHKRVVVKETSKDELQGSSDHAHNHPKNKRKNQPLMGRAMPDPSDNDYSTPTSRMTMEKKISSSDINVRSLTIDQQSSVSLTSLEASTFACVLHECLESLSILRYVIPAKIDERWDESYKTISQMYNVPDEPKMIFREDAGLLPLIPSVAAKIQQDRTYVYDILEKTYRNIKREETFESLEATVNDIIKIQEGERELEINCELWNEQAKQLRELVEYDNLEFEEMRKKKIEMAQELNAEVDHSIFQNGSKLGYVERWEQAQLEKQELKLTEKESELLRMKENCEKLEKADQIVSGEVKTYLEANTREMEDEIISWTSQYIEELERRQQEMSEFREHIMDQLLELNELKALKDSRQAFIDEVLAEKERLIREEEYWKGIHRAATIIQCQWRGYMVRKQIGPFKGLWLKLKRRKRGEGSGNKKKKNKSTKKKGN